MPLPCPCTWQFLWCTGWGAAPDRAQQVNERDEGSWGRSRYLRVGDYLMRAVGAVEVTKSDEEASGGQLGRLSGKVWVRWELLNMGPIM